MADALIVADTIAAVRHQVRRWRADGLRVGFVATMGNLHAGHLSLVTAARQTTDRVIASIFVNPLQFGPSEDFDAYPRTPRRDRRALESVDCDVLFAPSPKEMYPTGEQSTRITVGPVGNILCGAHRPGHFDGMATVVVKLLNIVAPDVAFFGEKDFQQLTIIKAIVADLAMPVEIRAVATRREADGLAMSSRNRYLTDAERQIAPRLYTTLQTIAQQVRNGARNLAELAATAHQQLREAGFEPDYVEIRDAADLAAGAGSRHLVILAAARLGRARLIDNIRVDLADEA